MSFVDLESEIEDQLVDLLDVGGTNQVFQINRFYATVNEAELIDYIQSKVKQAPAVFIRVSGDVAENLDTIGQLHSQIFTVELIIAANNHGKLKQIKGERRKVNLVKSQVLSRLIGVSLNLTGQSDCYFSYQSTTDLFTSEVLDVRQITLQVQGVVTDFTA